MKTGTRIKSFLLLFVAVLSAGCATAPEAGKMIPYVDYSTFVSSGHTLRIAAVTGGGETRWNTPEITNRDFRQALIDTLKKSGLFKEIYTDHAGDYELYTEIISQKVAPGLTAYVALLVRYRLVGTNGNQAVWTENIFSQKDAYGANLGKDAIEGAARDNFAQLIRKLAEILAEQNRKGNP